jgi:hypothetical protein
MALMVRSVRKVQRDLPVLLVPPARLGQLARTARLERLASRDRSAHRV